eukprot:4265191-Pyramimonas_sp.AAC.1
MKGHRQAVLQHLDDGLFAHVPLEAPVHGGTAVPPREGLQRVHRIPRMVSRPLQPRLPSDTLAQAIAFHLVSSLLDVAHHAPLVDGVENNGGLPGPRGVRVKPG